MRDSFAGVEREVPANAHSRREMAVSSSGSSGSGESLKMRMSVKCLERDVRTSVLAHVVRKSSFGLKFTFEKSYFVSSPLGSS